VFGLVGSGRTELLETIVGLRRADRGRIEVDGHPVRFRSPREAARAGVVLVPEDRQRQGLCFNLSVRDNLLLPRAQAFRHVLIRRDERGTADALVKTWRIRAASIDAPPDALSGGNQQKVVVAKWLETDARVLFFDEPARGIDVGTKAELFKLIGELAADGRGIVLISSYLPELINMCDRVLVLRDGEIAGELSRDELSEEKIAELATGVAA
jgi:ribose transport system ATP-binding protein